jgi:hypothetical protein
MVLFCIIRTPTSGPPAAAVCREIGGLANTKQGPWKLPLPEYIEELYIKHLKKKPTWKRSFHRTDGEGSLQEETGAHNAAYRRKEYSSVR